MNADYADKKSAFSARFAVWVQKLGGKENVDGENQV